MPDTNTAIMRRFIDDVINNADYRVLRELVHPDYVYRSPEQELRGPDALEALFTAYRRGLPDLHVAIDDVFASGDKVVARITLTGTHAGELMGLPATGQSVRVHGMVLSHVTHGRIAEEWEMLDMLGLLRQLGVATQAA
ncbi:ester cyclase [Comamonadaceae bacterium G21597-S1]|nr:ester cyclase [Comamonadaceae bacterium G21597-S1]